MQLAPYIWHYFRWIPLTKGQCCGTYSHGMILAWCYPGWLIGVISVFHDDVIKWKHFPRYWPFVRSPVTGEFPVQRPMTRSFDVFFDLPLNKRLRKHSKRRWFETPSSSLWRHGNVYKLSMLKYEHFFTGKLYRNYSATVLPRRRFDAIIIMIFALSVGCAKL